MRYPSQLVAVAAVVALAGCAAPVTTADSPTGPPPTPSRPAPVTCPAHLDDVPAPVPPEDSSPRPLMFEPALATVCRYDAAGGGDLVGHAGADPATTRRLWRLGRAGEPVTEQQICTMEIGTTWLLAFTGHGETAVWLRADDYGCRLVQPVLVDGVDRTPEEVAQVPAPPRLFSTLRRMVPDSAGGPG